MRDNIRVIEFTCAKCNLELKRERSKAGKHMSTHVHTAEQWYSKFSISSIA